MANQIDERVKPFEVKMGKSIASLDSEFGTIRAGRANPHVLDRITVDYYGTYGRADATGLIAAENYSFKIVPVIEEKEQDDAANEVTGIKVINYKREGFCFLNGNTPGAYNADGTLKANARVIYVTANTAKTVTCPVIGDKEQTV